MRRFIKKMMDGIGVTGPGDSMRQRLFAASVGAFAAFAVAAFSSDIIAGQTPAAGANAGAPTAKPYVVPRTPDGHPDLQGVWANNDATPLERPKELNGRKTAHRCGSVGAEAPRG